jgi:curved DNA-binding protein CbpA
MLAERYHPDNPRSGDRERYERLVQAYQILSKRESRAAYDVQYHARSARPIAVFETREFVSGIEGEPYRRMGILSLLYARRRSNPESPGYSILELEVVMSFPREHLMFSIWFLKDNGLIQQDQTSNYVITGPGADYLEKNLSSFESLRQMLRSAEAGRIERSAAAYGSEAVKTGSA